MNEQDKTKLFIIGVFFVGIIIGMALGRLLLFYQLLHG